MEKQILAIGYHHKGKTIIMTNTNITQTKTQYREVKVSQLPEHCVMRTRLELWTDEPNKATVNIVATLNEFGEWIAYIGYPSIDTIKSHMRDGSFVQYLCNYIHTQDQVLKLGDTLDKRSAISLFPEWRNRRYRNEI